MALNLFERTRMQPREQKMATAAVFVFATVLLLFVPVGLSMLVSSRTAANDELKEALTQVNQSRQKIKERQEKKSAIASRYAKKTPQLGGFIETTAATAKVAIADSVDRPDTPHGKQYNERVTTVHLKNSGLAPVVKFLELLEQSNYPVSVTRLNIRKRSAEADSYGPIEVGVSAYDRTAPVTTASPTPSSSSAPAPKK
jgi:Sec-independent protein translocase protein TatA